MHGLHERADGDEDAWRALEPGTAHPLQRLRAVRQLRDAGVNAGVLMAPIVPGFTTQPAKLEATIKAIADHGAAFVGANVMYLKDGTRDHFMGFLAREFPRLVGGLSSGSTPARTRRRTTSNTVRAMIDTLQERYDVGRRASIQPERRRQSESTSGCRTSRQLREQATLRSGAI